MAKTQATTVIPGASHRNNHRTGPTRLTQINPAVARQIRRAIADSAARQTVAPAAGTNGRVRHVRISVGNGHDRQVTGLEIPALGTPPGKDVPSTRQAVIVALPRRLARKPEPPEASARERPLSARLKVATMPSVGRTVVLARLVVWLRIILIFALQTLVDVVRRRNSPVRRAVLLRASVERAGGTLLKIGQQLSLRLDILPVPYCEQLAMMRDRMPPFSTAEAVAVIERCTGRPIKEIFATFDPVAIDTSSIWCVFQAVLRENGEKVAVKVRRPGIDVQFEADLRVLAMLARAAEALTIIPPGYGKDFHMEVRKTLIDELDFRRCARYEELFARKARKQKIRYFATRRIYYDYLSSEVMVREFASGMWLWEVLATLENGDETGLAYMRTLNLSPRKLARRLLYMHHWALFEHLTFHAAPSAENIIIGANNRLTFVDFGVNGFLRESRRTLFKRFYQCQAREDVWGMAQATVALLEPLPARDVNMLAKEIEQAYYERLLAMTSKHARWYERTSGAMWLAAFKVMNRYKIPAPVDVLIFVRATLLYDTLAARLWPKVDYRKALVRYSRDVHKRMKRRGARAMRARLRHGLLTDDEIGSLESIATAGENLLFRVDRLLNVPYDFAHIPLTIEKWVYILSVTIQFLVRGALLTGVLLLVALALQAVSTQALDVQGTWQQLTVNKGYWLVIAVIGLLHLRAILFRLNDQSRKDN